MSLQREGFAMKRCCFAWLPLCVVLCLPAAGWAQKGKKVLPLPIPAELLQGPDVQKDLGVTPGQEKQLTELIDKFKEDPQPNLPIAKYQELTKAFDEALGK